MVTVADTLCQKLLPSVAAWYKISVSPRFSRTLKKIAKGYIIDLLSDGKHKELSTMRPHQEKMFPTRTWNSEEGHMPCFSSRASGKFPPSCSHICNVRLVWIEYHHLRGEHQAVCQHSNAGTDEQRAESAINELTGTLEWWVKQVLR
jgi:hypothetical protein